MIVHNLKIKYEYAEKVALGIKTFELRKNDRNFQEGEYINFMNMDNTIYKIVYKLDGTPEYGLAEGYCILGIKPVAIATEEIK